MLATEFFGSPTVTLAIFDLDNTLIGDDSDHLWGQFACERALVDSSDFAERSDRFYADYQAGTLDIDAYLRLSLSTVKGRSLEELEALHRDFMRSRIAPIMLPRAAELIDDHRRRGHEGGLSARDAESLARGATTRQIGPRSKSSTQSLSRSSATLRAEDLSCGS